MEACPPTEARRPSHYGRWSTTRQPIAAYSRILRAVRSRDGGCDAFLCIPMKETRSGHSGSHAPIRAERSTLGSRALPPGRNETIRSRDRPLNRETLDDRPTLLTPPQRAADHPERPVERGEQEGQAHPEESDARVDDEPLHRGIEDAGASATTTRNPALRAHTTRVVERARKRNTITKTHFRSDLSH